LKWGRIILYIVVVVELPRAPGGVMYAACELCAAKVGFDGCEETKFVSMDPEVSKPRPINCPRRRQVNPDAAVQSLLRGQLLKRSR
jgi:hypothetical protein